ncbi:BMC domain-containing protein [bacterium]|nr:BMC domain-containing protein [bacterium]RQV97753.1 MAG: BMC domain-containing protein [bacterium]
MAKVALGFVETRGDTGSVVAIDTMVKTANVDLVKKVGIGGGYVTAIIRGEVGAVKSAVDAGAEAAAKVGELVCANVIASAHEDVFNLIGIKK